MRSAEPDTITSRSPAGAAAVGVGDFVHNLFQENWSAQIQAHGVADGLLDGAANAGSETGHQAAHLLHDIGSIF